VYDVISLFIDGRLLFLLKFLLGFIIFSFFNYSKINVT